jgi:hypothetical protein
VLKTKYLISFFCAIAQIRPDFLLETPGNSELVSPHDNRIQEVVKGTNKSRPRTAKASVTTNAYSSSSPGRHVPGDYSNPLMATIANDGENMMNGNVQKSSRPNTGRSQQVEGRMFDSLVLSSDKLSSYGGGFNAATLTQSTMHYSPKRTMKSPVMRSSLEFVFDPLQGQAEVMRRSVDDPTIAFKDVYEKDDNKITMRYRKKVMRPKSAMEIGGVGNAFGPTKEQQTLPSSPMPIANLNPTPLIVGSGKYKLAFKTLNLGIKGVPAR